MNYQELKRTISTQKLQPYESQLGCNKDRELIATYILVQSIQEKFYMPIQIVEVTLRNNMNDAIRERSQEGNYTDRQINRWYNRIPKTPKSKKQVQDATTKAKIEVKGRGHNHNDVIARLTFGFWVYLLDKPHRINDPKNREHQLWPFITDKVFPNRQEKEIPQLFNELNQINKIRNRLFHHEPICLGPKINSREEALNKMKEKYLLIIGMIEKLSPEKLELLKRINVIDNFNEACSVEAYNKIYDSLE